MELDLRVVHKDQGMVEDKVKEEQVVKVLVRKLVPRKGSVKMKIKIDRWQDFTYIVFCIATFGVIAVIRLVITKAIKMAFEDE